jgi:hypothetical protein
VTQTWLVGGGQKVGIYSDTHVSCGGGSATDESSGADATADASTGVGIGEGGDYTWGWGACAVVTVVFFLRLLDGYLSPLIFRRIAVEFPTNSGEITRWVALVEKATTFISAWIAFGLVESGTIGA